MSIIIKNVWLLWLLIAKNLAITYTVFFPIGMGLLVIITHRIMDTKFKKIIKNSNSIDYQYQKGEEYLKYCVFFVYFGEFGISLFYVIYFYLDYEY